MVVAHDEIEQAPEASEPATGERKGDQGDDTGVEEEDTSSAVTKPFDPNKIQVRLWTPTIDLLMKRIREGEIDLAPDFQRKAGIWKDKAQSQLIESILIRIPLPAFFIDGVDEDHLAVIDGIQRLTSLKRFVIDGQLCLSGMEFLTDLEGKYYNDLTRSLQRRIDETMVTVNIIEKGTPEDAKLNLFKRINTGGLSLSLQEIRHAINRGPARDFLRDLSESEEFLRATTESLSADRMDDRECVLRSVAFMLTPPTDYSPAEAPTNFDTFLNQAMRALNEMTPARRLELGRRFRRAMNAAAHCLGDKAFRKVQPERRGPINKALFESWAVNLDACSEPELKKLVARKDKLVEQFVTLIATNPEFGGSLSQSTGDRRKVQLRFREVAALIRRVLA
jgi:hypothetical protein